MMLTFKRVANGTYRHRLDELTLMLDRASIPADYSAPDFTGDVMLIRALYSRSPDGNLDRTADPYGYLCRPVVEDDVLLQHDGFVSCGPNSGTLAASDYLGRPLMLTPGRLHDGGVYAADTELETPIVPGRAYVKRDRASHVAVCRIEGVPDYADTALARKRGVVSTKE